MLSESIKDQFIQAVHKEFNLESKDLKFSDEYAFQDKNKIWSYVIYTYKSTRDLFAIIWTINSDWNIDEIQIQEIL